MHTDIPYRELGRTGERVSAVGIGGWHLALAHVDRPLAIRIVRTALDRGINFLDNCWDYNNGQSELRMGKALADGYRGKAFLMTKFDGRTKKLAAQQIDESLKRLGTDHVDLMQYHEVIRLEDPDRFFGEDGAGEALLAAQKAGKTRFLGFTGHKDPAVHLRMLAQAKERGFHFDAVQLPVNAMDAHFRSFTREVVPELVRQEIGVLGMKPLASGDILKSNTLSAIECLHYALSMPTSVVITGMDSMKILDQALEAVRTFRPLDEEQIAKLLTRTEKAAAQGRFERFKTDARFDATARNPAWIG
jgi:predicted aldo/keto reductase-like oxidoreductase